MFRVVDDSLSIFRIADLWAAAEFAIGDAELRQRREEDLRALLASAWWRCEFEATNGRSRLEMLKSLYRTFSDEIAFVTVKGARESYLTPLAGSRLTIPVPCENCEEWTLESCASAFGALAVKWERLAGHRERAATRRIVEAGFDVETESTIGYRLLQGEIEQLELTREGFYRWIELRGLDPPNFWLTQKSETAVTKSTPDVDSVAHPPSGNDGMGEHSSRQVRAIVTENEMDSPAPRNAVHEKRRGQRPTKRETVKVAMRSDLASGRLSYAELRDMLEKDLPGRYKGGRTMLRQARNEVLAEIAKSIRDK